MSRVKGLDQEAGVACGSPGLFSPEFSGRWLVGWINMGHSGAALGGAVVKD